MERNWQRGRDHDAGMVDTYERASGLIHLPSVMQRQLHHHILVAHQSNNRLQKLLLLNNSSSHTSNKWNETQEQFFEIKHRLRIICLLFISQHFLSPMRLWFQINRILHRFPFNFVEMKISIWCRWLKRITLNLFHNPIWMVELQLFTLPSCLDSSPIDRHNDDECSNQI